MNAFIAKIARFAVSKAAAFSYAVAVGVAGNLAFHFMQPPDPAPAVVKVPSPPRGETAGGGAIAPASPPAAAARRAPPASPAPRSTA